MPTTPTRRLTRPALALGTVALAALAAVTARSTPPALTWALLPYLALVAWNLLDRPEAAPTSTEAPTAEPAAVAGPPDPDPVAEAAPEPEAEPVALPDRPAPTRPRRRARARAIAPPEPAAWVQVGPGRYVRGEPPEPPPTAEPSTPEAEDPAISQTTTDEGFPPPAPAREAGSRHDQRQPDQESGPPTESEATLDATAPLPRGEMEAEAFP